MRRALAITLAFFALVLLVVELRYQPPAVVPASAPPDAFSGERARALQADLVATGPNRAVGTPGHERARQWIEERMRGFGWEVEEQPAVSCASFGVCARIVNVVATLPGADPDQGAVLVAAHYDAVGAGQGASDDGVGVASLLESARALSAGARPKRGMIFLFSDGEEIGLLGARAFVRENPLVKTVRAVVNVDARGTNGPSLMFETNEGNATIMKLVAAHLPRPVTSSLYYEVYKRMANGTDFDVLRDVAPGVVFANTWGIDGYHTPLDSLASSDPRTLQHDGENVLAMARAFSGGLTGGLGGPDAVWFDVLAFVVVAWPAQWSAILGLLAFALVAGQTLRRRETGIGLAAFLAAPLAVAVAYGLVRLLQLRAAPVPFIAHPVPALLALHAITAATIVALRRFLGARPEVIWAGVWFGWSVVGVALAVKVPGVSYLFVVPAFAAAVLGALRAKVGFAVSCVVPAVVAAVLFLALVPSLYESLGFSLLAPLLVLPTAVLGVASLPLLPDGSWGPALGLVGLTAVLALAAHAVPTYSVEHPQRLNVVHREGKDKPAIVWLENAYGGGVPSVPEPLAAELARVTKPNGKLQGEVPHLDLVPPIAEVVRAEDRDGKHVVRVRARSQRGATAVKLWIDPKRRFEVKAEGRFAFPVNGTVTLLSLPDAPLTLDIEADGPGPIDAFLLDILYGLPPGSPAASIAGARPATAHQTQDGDVTQASAKVAF